MENLSAVDNLSGSVMENLSDSDNSAVTINSEYF